MPRRYGLRIGLALLVIAATGYVCWMQFQPQPQLPFSVVWAGAHHALIEPIAGVTPSTLHAGDRLDLGAQSRATRIALLGSGNAFLPPSARYPLVIERGAVQVRVAVRTVDGNTGSLADWGDWIGLYALSFFAALALLALGRGHDRAAWGLAFWAMTVYPLSFGVISIHGSSGGIVPFALLGYVALSLAARVGFYVMAESLAGNALTARARRGWRTVFALALGAATVVALGGPIATVTSGWAGGMQPVLQFLPAAAYLVPVALLAVSFRHADARQRQRLRWLLWGSVLFVAGVVVAHVPLPLSFVAAVLINNGVTTVGASMILYAVLRHRVVDVSIAVNRALVYALSTSLVLGLFALLESLIERSAMSRGAGMVLELAVPLGVGAALSTVHRRIEAAVERYIFRRQYRAETALRRFSEECGFIREAENLFRIAVAEVTRHTGAPRVALYERTPEGYACRGQTGAPPLPETMPIDDVAFVGLRARNAEWPLHGGRSALGPEGYAYPLMLRGDLLGALVVGERPGEHYAADERALLFHVAHELGAALFALRAQESEARARESEVRARESETRARTSEILLQEARAREAALLSALSGSGVAGVVR